LYSKKNIVTFYNQWRNKVGGQPGYWPRAQTKKLKKSHTKGRKFFLKGYHFLRGAKILIWPRATNTLVTPLFITKARLQIFIIKNFK